MKNYDIIIVGAGASGLVAAQYLVARGFHTIVIEQGDFITASTNYDNLLAQAEPAYARAEAGIFELNGYPWSTPNVGGGTVFYGGASFRYREIDFDASNYIHSDLDPKFPYSYQTLAPYYDKIEEMVGIAKSVGIDPTEPPVKASLMPPHPMSVGGAFIFRAAQELGLSPFPTPLAINSIPYKGRSTCKRTSECIERYCPLGAKGDAFTVFGHFLLLAHNCTLLTKTKTIRILQNSANKVEGVEYINLDTKEIQTIRGKIVILACNAIQSAALLLKSKTNFAPNGIGNDFDMVGRGLSFKLSEYAYTIIDSPAGDVDYNGPFSTVSLTDYYIAKECPTGLGGLIYEAKLGKRPVLENHKVLLRVECIVSDHPHFYNRVSLSNKKDVINEPILILDYQSDSRDIQRLEFMMSKCELLLRMAGGQEIIREPSYYFLGSGHLHGTCRAGDDNKQYVLDTHSRVHSMDNLFVIDGSYMPYSGSVNPTLTIQAHALKTAEYISKIF